MKVTELIVHNVRLSDWRVGLVWDQSIFQLEEGSLLVGLVHFEIESRQVAVVIGIQLAIRGIWATIGLLGVVDSPAVTLTRYRLLDLFCSLHVYSLQI